MWKVNCLISFQWFVKVHGWFYIHFVKGVIQIKTHATFHTITFRVRSTLSIQHTFFCSKTANLYFHSNIAAIVFDINVIFRSKLVCHRIYGLIFLCVFVCSEFAYCVCANAQIRIICLCFYFCVLGVWLLRVFWLCLIIQIINPCIFKNKNSFQTRYIIKLQLLLYCWYISFNVRW